jgi:TM2 domain-containing membrane protein YozV
VYKIVGTDGHQYGPVSAEQVRAWIAENRANAQTLAQTEGSQGWKPLDLKPPPAGATAPPRFPPPPPPSLPGASNKIPAGICGILLGGLGIHKFILGYTTSGLIMLLVTLLTCGVFYPVMHIIGLIEGIIYLCKTDEEFVRLYVDGRKEWF